MSYKVKKVLLIIVPVIVLVISSYSIYHYLYKPIVDSNRIIENLIKVKTIELNSLKSMKNNKEKYEAELIEYKEVLDRYNLYLSEYGTYPKLIKVLYDSGRRHNLDILSITKGDNEITTVFNAKYSSVKDFIVELESIEFFYNCNYVTLYNNDNTSQLTLNSSSYDDSDIITIELSASFSNSLNFELSTLKNQIIDLLNDLKLYDAVVSE